MTSSIAVEIVDRQLDAYNARDLETYCSLFAEDACLLLVRERHELARGLSAIRAFYQARFASSPHLRCDILDRIMVADLVIDHERVTGIGAEAVEIVAVYEVRDDGRIQSVRFLTGSASIPPPMVPQSLEEV